MTAPAKQTAVRLQQAATLLQQGAWAKAEVALTGLTRELPKHDTLWFLLGTTRAQLGQAQAAEQAFRKALAIKPENAEALNNLGFVLEAQQRSQEAQACYERAIAIDASYANAQYNLALLLQGQAELERAQTHYRAAIDANPLYVKALNNLGLLLLDLGNNEDALAFLNRARALAPDDAEIVTNTGHALCCLHRFEEAIELHDRALALAPSMAQTHSNRGLALQACRQLDAAARAFKTALTLQPSFVQAKHNLAHLQLASGHFAEGWKHYASRPSRRTKTAEPVWVLDADLSGKTILIHGEQGLGDELFFLRFAAELAQRGAHISVACAAKLETLLHRVPGLQIAESKNTLRPGTIELLVGDLPAALDHSEARTLPPPLQLSPLPERVAAMRRALASAGPPPYIGLTWKAGTPGLNRLDKQILPSQLEPLFTSTPCTWVALQRNPLPEDLAEFSRFTGHHLANFCHVNADLEDMLALLSALDDYVGVSNTNMHLRAAVGLPAQVLVPNPPEWRWLLAGERSPWFPTFNVMRQTPSGDWTPAITQCRAALAQRLHRHSP